jgi:hypothetical protein
MTDVQDHASLEADNVYKVWPAWIAINDGGATPITWYHVSAMLLNMFILICTI